MASNIIDFRDEFFLKTFRRLYVIKCLSENKKFSLGVELSRAALVDFLLCNPAVLQALLVSFGKAQPLLNLDEVLYQNNMEYGSLQEVQDFAKTCVILINQGYVRFSKNDGEITIAATEVPSHLHVSLLDRWQSEISAILPLMSKSVNVLRNAILGAVNGN